jgi:hypothetical protein
VAVGVRNPGVAMSNASWSTAVSPRSELFCICRFLAVEMSVTNISQAERPTSYPVADSATAQTPPQYLGCRHVLGCAQCSKYISQIRRSRSLTAIVQ